MTPIVPTGINIATLRGRLRKELHDEDEAAYRWVDSVLDRHLTRATRELSTALPREQKTTLMTTPGSRDLSTAELVDLVRVEAVEFPPGQWPPAFVPFSLFGSNLTLLIDGAPAAVQPVAVYWGRLHSLDTNFSTLPPVAEDVVVTGAAAYAALEWASFATNRANVAGSAAFENYRTWGEERLQQFRESVRLFGRDARVRNATLYQPARTTTRATVQWPG